MRRRFLLATYPEYVDALIAKKVKMEEAPDREFQIRRNKDGFKLVERLTSTEAKVIQEHRKPKKRRGSSYVW